MCHDNHDSVWAKDGYRWVQMDIDVHVNGSIGAHAFGGSTHEGKDGRGGVR